jgi:hypothetical protein
MALCQKVNQQNIPITTENLLLIAGLNGFVRIEDLAERIGKSRTAVHCAVRHPERYPRTYELLNDVLKRRRIQ